MSCRGTWNSGEISPLQRVYLSRITKETFDKAYSMIGELYQKGLSDKKIWEELKEEGIRISRPKVTQIRRKLGPPTHRQYGAISGLTKEQFEWWNAQEDRPLLMRNIVAFLMTLSPDQLELFKRGKLGFK